MLDAAARLRQLLPQLPPPATEEQIQHLEQQLGFPLPPVLRSIYLDHDGQPDLLPLRLLSLGEVRHLRVSQASNDPWIFWQGPDAHVELELITGPTCQTIWARALNSADFLFDCWTVDEFVKRWLDQAGQTSTFLPTLQLPVKEDRSAIISFARTIYGPDRASRLQALLETAEDWELFLHDANPEVRRAARDAYAQGADDLSQLASLVGNALSPWLQSDPATSGGAKSVDLAFDIMPRRPETASFARWARQLPQRCWPRLAEAMTNEQHRAQIEDSQLRVGSMRYALEGKDDAALLRERLSESPWCPHCGEKLSHHLDADPPPDALTCSRCQHTVNWWQLHPRNPDPAGVRKRPGMYFGDLGPGGANHLACEPIGNSLDQVAAGRARRISVKVDEWTLEVEDDGPGFFEKPYAERFLKLLHFTASADGHAPHLHLSFGGAGLAAVNVMCSHFEIEACQGTRLTFERGELRHRGHTDRQTGTRVRLELDRTVWLAGFTPARLRRLLFDVVHLVPGLTVDFNQERFHAPDGLLALARFTEAEEWAGNPLEWGATLHHPELTLQVACSGLADDDSTTHIRSWVNGSVTPENGSHVDGIIHALQRLGWRPAAVMVHAMMLRPAYANPVRRKLTLPHVAQIVDELVAPLLTEVWTAYQARESPV